MQAKVCFVHYMQFSTVVKLVQYVIAEQGNYTIIHFIILLITGCIVSRSTTVLRFVLNFLILVQCTISVNQLIQCLILGVGVGVYRLKIAKGNVVTVLSFVLCYLVLVQYFVCVNRLIQSLILKISISVHSLMIAISNAVTDWDLSSISCCSINVQMLLFAISNAVIDGELNNISSGGGGCFVGSVPTIYIFEVGRVCITVLV